MTPSRPSATQVVLDALLAAGVTHVTGIPDNTSAPLFDALHGHPALRLVAVTREGEALALAAGLWLGGASPLVLIQNTGLLEAGDALRGTAVRMGAPVPMVVTCRGYAGMEAAGLGPSTPRTPGLLTRADLDSVAFLTEPTLDAWGIPYTVWRGGGGLADAVSGVVADAWRRQHPAALLVTGPLA